MDAFLRHRVEFVIVGASLTGVPTERVWDERVTGRLEGREVSFISLDLLLANKLATGRPKDRLDADNLRRLSSREGKGKPPP